ncbi:uncharacterized protein PHACADRAFT_212986 [Phanerochaete carnosa HHB-10118-sp]|uniref:N-acetyltransferase domain-containing protein n=1 Tax=Phanerochaete carnosa (strain HHB-10118-sp) TaxID=650164 RepID=K5UMZ1_PHACS|nr:uncharacterized protein PHACADRAFT_212986 [Phanerochaete carnosa HHB-10118-sp]EKM51086.1 hypothetical protein PHACADRAFT_212986 [Phanerochaete carnosa HHB-10118-sp]
MCATYDPNVYFPIKEFESDRIKLVPFRPEVDGEAFYTASAPHPELYEWTAFGPFSTAKGFLDFIEGGMHLDPSFALFVIYNKSTENQAHQLAGLIGLLNTNPANLSTEMGPVFTLPPFQRTHVTTHAIGLLLAHCFEELKLRRVQWQTNALNEKSIGTAQKMGFTLEGIVRWQLLLAPGKHEHGLKPREGDPKPECYGRNTALLSVCWDDWESGVNEKVRERMARR